MFVWVQTNFTFSPLSSDLETFYKRCPGSLHCNEPRPDKADSSHFLSISIFFSLSNIHIFANTLLHPSIFPSDHLSWILFDTICFFSEIMNVDFELWNILVSQPYWGILHQTERMLSRRYSKMLSRGYLTSKHSLG